MEKTRREVKGALPRPSWWQCRNEEIEAACKAVKKGNWEVIAHSPGGFPLYAVTYGEPAPQTPLNWPSATGSPRPELYADNRQQVIMIVAGIHGEEPEGGITVMNLISAIETGTDLRGVPQPKLASLASAYRLVLVPCVNPDARSIAPDCGLGSQFEDFAEVVYTRLADGTQLRWPQLKEYFPMPMERVARLGTYYNSEGVNIQLDASPANIRSPEAAALLKLADRERIDIFLNLHSDGSPHLVSPSALNYPGNINVFREIRRAWLAKRGVEPGPEPGFDNQTDINAAVTLSTGAVPITFEFGLLQAKSHGQLLMEGYDFLETVFEYGLGKPFAPRRTLRQ